MDTSSTIRRFYLDICIEFIEKRFGKNPGISRPSSLGCVLAEMVEPEDGGNVCLFDQRDLCWIEATQDFVSFAIRDDGKVHVYDTEGINDENDMLFHVQHPQEVAELIHLFVQPAAKLVAALSESQFMKLGKIADLYALIPAHDGWHVLDLAHLPADMPDDFRTALGLNMVQKWEGLISGESCEACKFVERWADFVGGLPAAAPLLRGGYVISKDRRIRHGLSLLADGVADSNLFVSVLLVCSRDDVSSLFLSEYLAQDKGVYQHLQASFADENDLDTICAMLKKISICMPKDFTDQIKLAAQTNLMRQQFLLLAECLINCRAPYKKLGPQYQAAVDAIRRMVDTAQRYSERI